MVACGKDVLVSGIHTQITVFLRSTNGGQTWRELDPFSYYFTTRGFQVIDSNNIVACGSLGQVYRSFDGGASWVNQSIIDTNRGNSSPLFTCIHFSDPATGIVTANGNQVGTPDLYTTTDSGNHWNPVTIINDPTLTIGHSYGSGMYRVAVPIYSPIFNENEIYTTHDNWKSYDSVQLTGSFEQSIPNYCFGMGDTFVAYNTITSPDPEHTTDGGLNWQESTLMDSTYLATDMSRLDQNPVFLVGEELDTTKINKVFVSFDHGESWQTKIIPSANDTPILWIKNVTVTQNGEAVAIIVAKRGTQHTVEQDYLGYLAPIQEGIEEPISSPSIFAIYPNPASNVLTVENAERMISILDPLGRTYSVPRTGNHLDVSSLPTGIYFVTDGNESAKFVKE